MAEIEALIERGGMTPEQEPDLWECLFLSPKEIAELL
jgi:hypothetical protein